MQRFRYLKKHRIVRRIINMRTLLAMAVLAMLTLCARPTRADENVAIDLRIAIERDDLMRPTDGAAMPEVRPNPEPASSTKGRGPWPMIDATMLVVSTVALAVDWRQTRSAASEDWTGRLEDGYLARKAIGLRPSVHIVDGYFALSAAANAALWALLPTRWRSIIPGVVIGGEIPTIVGNLSTTHL